jgi:lysyl-tRNA synthetase, class II
MSESSVIHTKNGDIDLSNPIDPVTGEKLSKNALKKLMKKAKRNAGRQATWSATKSATKSVTKSATKSVAKSSGGKAGSETDSFEALREADLQTLEDAGFPRYCYKYLPTYPSMDPSWSYTQLRFDHYHRDYADVENEGEVATDRFYTIGRVNRLRRAGGKLLFVDIRIGGDVLQMKVNRMTYLDGDDAETRSDRFRLFRSVIRIGDIWGFAGHVGRTNAGELSLYVHQMRLCTPCMQQLPPATKEVEVDGEKVVKSGLSNPEVRFRMRELDMIVNPSVYQTFRKRSQIIRELQNFLEDRLGLIRVDTPILTPSAGGATAKPFMSHSNDYGCDLFMRIAPELYLKRLVVAGFPGVYEIGKQFRNESNDLTHNSEFTSLEYYLQNADYNDLMEQCEWMLAHVVQAVNGSLKVSYGGNDIDFTPPFRRLDMLDALREYAGIEAPDDLSTDAARDYLDAECVRLEVDCSEPRTTARLLDKLVGEFVEAKCQNPTYIVGHPKIMSPLAKPDRFGSQRTERFELFVSGTELANAYTELNDPKIQEENFRAQARAKADGDDEAMMFDSEFVQSLKVGLPPTGGFGMGIDRLTMFLTDNQSIREVILFPTMKPGPYNSSLDEDEVDADAASAEATGADAE